MGDDINDIQQKRNTDCVYFLASPLTCKKGLECEYRHNEIARLNPRDCWYWLAGNCLNPTCVFRHPPLEMHGEVPPESSSSSALANKTNVPCYFYFNGFCNKGDRCSFMHVYDANMPSGASGIAPSAVKEDISLDSKTLGNGTVAVPKELRANSCETAAKTVKTVMDFKQQNKEDFQFPASEKNVIRSPSPQIAVSRHEEGVALKPGFLLRAESFTESRSQVYTEQSSEEEMDGHVEPDERWESSPGFDVLVNDKSESLGYEDDHEYLLPLDRERLNLNNHILGYDFENLVEYDPAEDDYEGGNYVTGFVDNVGIFDDVGSGSGLGRNPVSDFLLSRKRKLVATELSINDRRVDLRDRLGKRRLIGVQPVIRSSRKHYGSYLHCESHGSYLGPGSKQRLHGRLALEVRNDAIRPHHKTGNLLIDTKRQGWHRHSPSNMSRRRHKEKSVVKKQFHSSEILRKPREKKSNQEPTQFTGPKTLAQIKEEKKRAEENGGCTGKTGNSSIADFESPKPLSEILKGKRRLSSA